MTCRNVISCRKVVLMLLCMFVLLVAAVDKDYALAPDSSYGDIQYVDDLPGPGSSPPYKNYIHRGDWETPDLLVVVDNHEWLDSLQKIVIASHQDGVPVYILADQDENGEEKDKTWTFKGGKGRVLKLPHDSPWIRDYGPIQLKTPERLLHWMDFGYAQERPNDDNVPRRLAEYTGMPIEIGKYYLEGGAIISNGKGLCAITDKNIDEAFVDPESPEDLEEFRQLLGCRALAILPALSGESTGHADIIAQFLSQDTIAVSYVEQEVSYKNAAELDDAVESLVASARSFGQKLRIMRIPMHVEGEHYYSYVNGTRLKNTYLMPSFESVPAETEKMAYRLMRSALHDVRLVPIPADSMTEKGGAVHCITLGLSIPRSADRPYLVRYDEKTLRRNLFSYIQNTIPAGISINEQRTGHNHEEI